MVVFADNLIFGVVGLTLNLMSGGGKTIVLSKIPTPFFSGTALKKLPVRRNKKAE